MDKLSVYMSMDKTDFSQQMTSVQGKDLSNSPSTFCKFSIHFSGTTISLITLSHQVLVLPDHCPKFRHTFLPRYFFKNFADVLDP